MSSKLPPNIAAVIGNTYRDKRTGFTYVVHDEGGLLPEQVITLRTPRTPLPSTPAVGSEAVLLDLKANSETLIIPRKLGASWSICISLVALCDYLTHAELVATAQDWFWSTNQEHWVSGPYTSRADAIADAEDALDAGDEFYTGRAVQITGKDFSIDAGHVLEQVGEDASEMVGDVAERWPTHYTSTNPKVKELGDRLTQVLEAWIDEHDPPYFFKIVDDEEHVATGAPPSKDN